MPMSPFYDDEREEDPLPEPNTPEDDEDHVAHAAQDDLFEQGAYDDPPPNLVMVWPMSFAQYVKSESASA